MSYDVLGRGYAAHRRADPRIAALVDEAHADLLDADTYDAGFHLLVAD